MDVAIRDAVVAEAADGRGLFDALREAGVGSVEIEVDAAGETPHVRGEDGKPYSVADDAGAQRLRARLDAEGVRACALLVCNDFASAADDDQLERQVGSVVRAVRAAAVLGAPVVRIDPLARDKSVKPAAGRERFVRGAGHVLRLTADMNVDLGMENHGPHANDPGYVDAVLAALPDSRLGLTLDTGNFYWFGFRLEEVYELIEKYAPVAKHTHLKNINYPPDLASRNRPVGHEYGRYCCGVHEGNLDLGRVARSLRGAGYARDLCIEDESLGKHPKERRLDVLRRGVEALRGAIRS